LRKKNSCFRIGSGFDDGYLRFRKLFPQGNGPFRRKIPHCGGHLVGIVPESLQGIALQVVPFEHIRRLPCRRSAGGLLFAETSFMA
jgi:hypothetical protein